jgi:hypothetical protein
LPEESRRLELVLVNARGESLPYRRRRHTRVPAQLRATVTARDGISQQGATTTMGAGGAHIKLERPIEVDEQIALRIALSDRDEIDLVGRVTSRIDDGPERGSSVEFLFRSAAERDRIAELAEELRAGSHASKSEPP